MLSCCFSECSALLNSLSLANDNNFPSILFCASKQEEALELMLIMIINFAEISYRAHMKLRNCNNHHKAKHELTSYKKRYPTLSVIVGD